MTEELHESEGKQSASCPSCKCASTFKNVSVGILAWIFIILIAFLIVGSIYIALNPQIITGLIDSLIPDIPDFNSTT